MEDDLRFYTLFNSVSVISGRWEVDNERLCNGAPFTVEKIRSASGDRTRSARSEGQRLNH